MAGVIRMMKEVAAKLEIQFDAGESTQVLQRRILSQLDEAIKTAAAQRRPNRKNEPMPGGDKRRMPQRTAENAKKKADGQKRTADAAKSGDAVPGAGAGQTSLTGGSLEESRRSWGNLPSRERDEVIQGSGERFLERYRAWIERYYRALQEVGD
jgi:hypothetical protein